MNNLLLSRFSRVRLCATPQMAAHQAPPSLGLSRQSRQHIKKQRHCFVTEVCQIKAMVFIVVMDGCES